MQLSRIAVGHWLVAALIPFAGYSATAHAAEEDQKAVVRLIERYEAALESLDVDAYMEIWPSANEKQIRRNFSKIRQQKIDIRTVEVQLEGSEGKATCSFSARLVDTRGEEHQVPESSITVLVRRAEERWRIVEMEQE